MLKNTRPLKKRRAFKHAFKNIKSFFEKVAHLSNVFKAGNIFFVRDGAREKKLKKIHIFW